MNIVTITLGVTGGILLYDLISRLLDVPENIRREQERRKQIGLIDELVDDLDEWLEQARKDQNARTSSKKTTTKSKKASVSRSKKAGASTTRVSKKKVQTTKKGV